MTLLESVRAAVRRGRKPRVATAFAADEWRATEAALFAELRASPRTARRLADAFARLAATDGSAEARGRAARLRGSWLSYAGRDRDAVASYRDAIRLLTGLARDGARLGLAASLTRLGRFADARRLCADVRDAARERGDAIAVASADLNEGVARHESGDVPGAVGYYRRAREAFDAAGHAANAASAADNLGNACVALDRYDEAESAYDAAARGFDAAGLPHEALRCRMNRASLLVATDRLGDADALLAQCETEFRAAGDPFHAALSRRDRGETLLRAGLVPEAVHALTSAGRALAGAPPAERERTAALLARALLAKRDAAGARRAARQVRDRASSLEISGRIAALDGDMRGAARRLARAADAFGTDRPAAAARCLAASAWAAHEAGDTTDAARAAAAAERAAFRVGMPSSRFAASATRFVVEAGAGRRPVAETSLAAAADALEAMRAGLGPDTMRSALLRGRETWLASAVRFLLDGPDGARRALAFLERWRARSLVDLLADDTASSGPEARVAAIRRVVAGLEKRAEGSAQPGFLRAQFTPSARLLRRLREAEDELLAAAEREASPATAPPTERELDALRSSLPEGSALLAPFADERGVVTFVADASGVSAHRTAATAGDVSHAVRDLHFALGSASLGPDYVRRHESRLRRAADAALARIANVTLDPVADRLAGVRRLIIVPHGAWNHVPFAALPWSGGRLAERVAVTLLPALAALREPPPPATGRPLVVSVPDEAAPQTRIEAERVAAALGADRLDGADATAAALAAADRPACLHVAAHGRHRADAPSASGVRLADGWFRAAEFARLRLGGSLVVLSGCETGLTSVDAGDEAHGLVRGVLAAGARDVVSALWRVDDAATARFMERFHAVRRSGAGVADALATVQAEHAAAGANPWLWAGFVHHGRGV